MNKLYDIWFQKLKLSIYDKIELLRVSKVTDMQALYEADTISYSEWGLSRKGIETIQKSKAQINACHNIIVACQKEKVEMVGYFDENYPKLLKEIPDPPLVLYCKGNTDLLNKPSIAIVGTRQCTEQGDYMTKKLAMELTDEGFVVTSGMATGIDAVAHKSALINNGESIAVLGSGADVCYPKANFRIYEQLIEKGCVISEYEPYTQARSYHFPCRNRIICGITYGTIVVEAAQRSGALITANLAAEYGREVGAVPGNPFSHVSQGTNTLIEDGAIKVMEATDLINQIPKSLWPVRIKKNKSNKNTIQEELTEYERLIYAHIDVIPVVLEDLEEQFREIPNLRTCLLSLRNKKLIEPLPGDRYRRIIG